MEKMEEFMQAKFAPAMAKFSRNTYVQAITKSFGALLSITLIGSIATLLTTISWEPWANLLNATGLGYVLNMIYTLTVGSISAYLVLLEAYFVLSKKFGSSSRAIPGMAVAFAAFLVCNPLLESEMGNGIATSYLGSFGMFVALILGLLVSAIYAFLVEHKVVVKMPSGVPEMVANGFESLIPGTIILLVFGYIGYAFTLTSFGSLAGFVTGILAKPLTVLQGSIWTLLLIEVIYNLLWFFGIHGGAVIGGITNVLYMSAAIENVEAFAAGNPLPHIITIGFSGGTSNIAPFLGISIAILLVVKKKTYLKNISTMALVPSFFGITEPVRFGVPLTMNFIFLIPQILIPTLCKVIWYVGTVLGLVARPHAIGGWGIPYLVCGFMTSGVSGVICEIICVIFCVVAWIPFIKMYDNMADPVEEDAE